MADEVKPTFLEEVEAKKNALVEVIRDADGKIKELKELQAIEILSGKTEAGNKPAEKPVEISPVDYAKNALKGIV